MKEEIKKLILKITNNSKNYLLLLLILAVVILSIFIRYNQYKLVQALSELELSTQQVDSFRNKNGLLINEINTIKFTSEESLRLLSDEIFNLKKENQRLVKKVNSLAQITQKLQIDSIYIPYTETVYIDTLPSNIISVPKDFIITDPYYSIGGTVLKGGVRINNLNLSDTLSLREIEKKQGLFKPTVSTLQVIHSNPYITNTNIMYIKVKEKPSFFGRYILPTAIGIGAGITTYKILK